MTRQGFSWTEAAADEWKKTRTTTIPIRATRSMSACGTNEYTNDDFALHRWQKLCFMPYDLRPMTHDL